MRRPERSVHEDETNASPAAPGRRSGRLVLLIALAAVLVLLGGAGTLLGRAGTSPSSQQDRSVAAPPPPTVTAPATPSPSATSTPGPGMPDPRRLAAALQKPLRDPGLAGPAGMQVADLATGRVLFDQDSAKPDVPASTAKLLTATVALERLGPQTRLRTRVLAAGDVLYLVGAGDPTLTRTGPPTDGRVAGAAPARVDDLARQIRAAGIGRASAVVSDTSLFAGPAAARGWRPYYFDAEVAPVSALAVDGGRAGSSVKPLPRTGDPARAARDALRSSLADAGVAVPDSRSGRVPAGAREVAVVDSPPVADLVRRMLTYSDNDLAEALGRLVAVAGGHPADFAGSVAGLTDGLRQLGLPVDGLRLEDASGLSHDDRIPPALLVQVLRTAADPAHPELRAVLDGLPVAGRTGTLDDRFGAADTEAGVDAVHAKSGRLAGVAALAGTVRTREGRTLVFSVRAPSVDLTVGEVALDRIASTLARCGCR